MEAHGMKIHFDKLYKDDRNKELCGICIPFKKGALSADKTGTVSVLDGKRVLPAQSEVTGTWEDGSVRYAYVHFLADLPGNMAKELELTYQGADNYGLMQSADSSDTAGLFERVSVIEDTGSVSAENGILKFTLKENSNSIFDEFEFAGSSFLKERFVGPFVTLGGERLTSVFDSWKVVKKGDILSVIEGSGRFLQEKNSLSGEGLKFEIRLSVTAGKPWIDVGFRFINCTKGDIKPDDIIFAVKTKEDSDLSFDSPIYKAAAIDSTGCGDTKGTDKSGDIITTTGIRNLPEIDADARKDSVRSIVGKSNYKTEFKISQVGDRVENTIIAEMLEKEANEHFAEVLYGTFFADLSDNREGTGVCATVFQAFQNFPKAVRSDKDGLVIYLLPDQSINVEKTKAQSVVFTSGMAREQRFLLHFHRSDEPIYELDNRSLIYQMPDKPYIDPMEFAKAGVMPDVFLPMDEQNDDVEIALIEKADGHARCYGMLNFGDGPDPGYTAQGRGGGNLVWTNNEYDFPHAMYMMYARSGVRRFLDYANTAASHWMDVDVCHYSDDPLRIGGQWEHTRRHTGGSEDGDGCRGEMVCSHEWVEGLLDMYHFTADERAYNTAIGIGENVLRLLETPMYQVPGEASARETGWALRTLTALYIETHDEKWLKRCEWIVSQFGLWNDRYGNWLAPYTDNTTIRVGFMISVAVGSLMRYYRVFPSDELKKLMLDAIDDLTENFMTPQHLFVYKELPSLNRNGTNTLLLESMAIGYELTGDKKYLEYGKKTFKRAVAGSSLSIGGKRIVEDTVISGSGAPKNFAQSFLPITSFYVALVTAKEL